MEFHDVEVGDIMAGCGFMVSIYIVLKESATPRRAKILIRFVKEGEGTSARVIEHEDKYEFGKNRYVKL